MTELDGDLIDKGGGGDDCKNRQTGTWTDGSLTFGFAGNEFRHQEGKPRFLQV